ncbi:MAG: hypothetical protein HY904_14765 [Deltaproteobacteria bacterium]|nr:hypothetical protein [Deltaproteobacteria bacterium]
MITAMLLVTLAGAPAVEPAGAEVAAPAVEWQPVKKGRAAPKGSSSASSSPFKGELGWLLAGLAASVVPLLLVALPCIWFAWVFGPAAPFSFLVVVLWASLVVGASGFLAWLLMSWLGGRRGGLLVPTLVATGVGLVGTLVAGIIAAVLVWSAWGAGFGGMYTPAGYYGWGLAGPLLVLAFLVWGIGLIGVSLGGPLLAAWVNQRMSVPKSGDKVHFDVLKPGE